MQSRLGALVAVLALGALPFAGGAAGSPTARDASRDGSSAASSLPAWGTEPVPQFGSGRSELHAISVLSATRAWAVGVVGLSQAVDARPLVERWDGTSWTLVHVPHISGAELYGVVEIAPDDVWMVGTFNNSRQSLMLHWDGQTITRVDTPNPGVNRNDLYAVTAIGPDDVWAVGDKVSGITDPLTLHWDGSRWSEVSAPGTASYDELYGVTAGSADDVWAVGVLDDRAATLHWDGSTWSRVDVPVAGSDTSLAAVSAVAPDDVWAVGQDTKGSLAVRWNGTQWKEVSVPDTGGTLRDSLTGIHVLGDADVWAVGTSYLDGNPGSLAWHWNGARWQRASTPHPPASTSQLEAASAGADRALLVAGSLNRRASALRLDGDAFRGTPVEQIGTDLNQLFGISADGPNDIWTVGSVGEFNPEPLTLHYDGSSWTRVRAPAPPVGTQLEDVVTLAPDDAWAVGYTDPGDVNRPVALHWNGVRWQSTRVPEPGEESTRLLAVDALGPDDVWAVGVYDIGVRPVTMIVHWDGAGWSLADTTHCDPPGGLSGIRFLAQDDGWAVGHASICRWDGHAWTLVASPQPRPAYSEVDYPLRDVSGASPDDVWAVGGIVYDHGESGYAYASLAEHWDGTSWQRGTNPSPNGDVLNGVEAVTADDVWAVGRDDFGPVIVRWNGHAWGDVPTPNRDDGLDLRGLTQVAGDELVDAGRASRHGMMRSLVQRVPSPTQGAVIGSSNVGEATVSYTGVVSGVVDTDPTGGFQVGGLPVGRYRFTLSYQGCTPVTKGVLVVAGDTRRVDLHARCAH